jgi:osmotically-inducible protein OsmY
MNKPGIALIATAFALAFSTGAIAQNMSKADYHAAKNSIDTEYKSARQACASLADNKKEICEAEAKGKEKVAKAELKSRNAPGIKHTYALQMARADADYSLAKEKCDDKADSEKKACVTDAKTAKTNAKAEAEAQMKTAKESRSHAKTASAASTSKHEGAKEYLGDSVITAKVKAAVLEESSLKSAEINVETFKGVVQLSGFVRSHEDISKAAEVARRVKGVESVKNVMIVKGQQ